MQGQITLIEGDDLHYLCAALGLPKEGRPYAVRIHQTGDSSGVKVKVNGGMWSPRLGMKDPDS
jgi:hypothetical protein